MLLLRYLTLIIVPIALLVSCTSEKDKDPRSHTVIVSLAPYKYVVEQIAGDTVKVKLLVPTGGSPHSYEPTAKQMLDTSKADIWFQMGENFEEKAQQALKSYRSEMKMVNLLEGIDHIKTDKDSHGHCTHQGCIDPHVWLSPRRVKKQAETITNTLKEIYPEYAEIYHKALRKLQIKLDDLDLKISGILHSMKNKTILVSHPAYAYFCQDYGLSQISIEFEGKEPSPKHLTKILERAKHINSPFVFIQAQHSAKGSQLIANEIGAEVITLDPLSENYMENMEKIAKSFAAQ